MSEPSKLKAAFEEWKSGQYFLRASRDDDHALRSAFNAGYLKGFDHAEGIARRAVRGESEASKQAESSELKIAG